MMTRAYPGLVFVLVVVGVLVIRRSGSFRGHHRHRHGAALLALGLLGPLAWTVTAPMIASPTADLALRAWPFLFLGVAVYVAAGLDWTSRRFPRRLVRRFAPRRRPGLFWSAPILFLLLAGGIAIGDNQGGRFPANTPARAAGPETATKDMVAAAGWLRNRGTGQRLVGDQQSQVIFSVYGDQQSPGFGSWIPFRDETEKGLNFYIDNQKVRFLVVDRRISTLKPRYLGYFGKAELTGWGNVDYGQPTFPAALLDKFNQATRLGLIYDNGNMQIYDDRFATRVGG